MLFFDGGAALIILALWLFCLFDVITTDAILCRNLPKMAWLFIVLFLPDVGSIIWLVAGHPWQSTQRPGGLPYKGNTGYATTGYSTGRSREGRRPTGASNPDDDADFQRQLRERVEEQRRSAPRRPEEPPTV